MAYEQRENSGSIFKNEKKESDNHPDSTGSALIGGVEYWVAGWRKFPDGKKAFLSLSFTPKDEQKKEPPVGMVKPDLSDDDPLPEDSIPF